MPDWDIYIYMSQSGILCPRSESLKLLNVVIKNYINVLREHRSKLRAAERAWRK